MAGYGSPARSGLSTGSKTEVLQDVLFRQAEQMQQFEKLLKKLPGQVRNEQRRRLEHLRQGQDNVMEALNFLVGARSPSATSCRSFGSRSGSKTKTQRSNSGWQTPGSPWAASTRTPGRGSSVPSSASSITRSGRQSPWQSDPGTPWNRDVLSRRESSQSAGSNKSSRRPSQQSQSDPRIQPGMVLYRSSSVQSARSEPQSETRQRLRSPWQAAGFSVKARATPGHELRESEQRATSTGPSGGSSRKSAEVPQVRVRNEENIIPPSALRNRERRPKKSSSVPDLDRRSFSSRDGNELNFWERLHNNWTRQLSPQSARSSRHDRNVSAMEKLLQRDFAYESPRSSAYSYPSTPPAGECITASLHDHGRTHFNVVDHLNDPNESEVGHGQNTCVHDDGEFDRNIGHGRKKFSFICEGRHDHLKGTAAHPRKRRNSGNHGHKKEEEVGSDGMPACIGHGRAKVTVKDHLWDGESDCEVAPGTLNGKELGLFPRCLKKVLVNHRTGWPDDGEYDLDHLPAGLSSRDIECARRPRDPTHPKLSAFQELRRRQTEEW